MALTNMRPESYALTKRNAQRASCTGSAVTEKSSPSTLNVVESIKVAKTIAIHRLHINLDDNCKSAQTLPHLKNGSEGDAWENPRGFRRRR